MQHVDTRAQSRRYRLPALQIAFCASLHCRKTKERAIRNYIPNVVYSLETISPPGRRSVRFDACPCPFQVPRKTNTYALN